MVTDAELIFWIVAGVLAILFFLAIPFIDNYMKNEEAKRVFAHYNFEEYHDDMEG